MKNLIAYVAANKASIVKKALIITGSAVGIVLTAGVVMKASGDIEILEAPTSDDADLSALAED